MPNIFHEMVASPETDPALLNQVLEETKFDVNERDLVSGKRAIEYAVRSGNPAIVKYLVEGKKVNLSARFKNKNLIDYAKLNPNPEVLEYVCRPEIVKQFEDGTTDLHVAAITDNPDRATKVLSTDPAQLKSVNQRGETALNIALRENRQAVVNAIITHEKFVLLSDPAKLDPVHISHLQNAIKKSKATDVETIVAEYQTAIDAAEKAVVKKGNEFYFAKTAAQIARADVYDHHEDKQYGYVKQYRKYVDEATNTLAQLKPDLSGEVMYRGSCLNIAYAMKWMELISKIPGTAQNQKKQLIYAEARYLHIAKQLQAMQKSPRKTIEDLKCLQNVYEKLLDIYVSMRSISADDSFRITQQLGRFKSLQSELAAEIECFNKHDALVKKWGVTRVDVLTNGDCFFLAAADQLRFQGIGAHIAKSDWDLRQLAAKRVLAHPGYYGDFLDGHGDSVTKTRRYAKEMRQEGVWGDQTAINALARALNVVIFILHSNGNPIITKPEKPIGALLMFYDIEHKHYQSLHFDPEMQAELSITDAIENAVVMTAEPAVQPSTNTQILLQLEEKSPGSMSAKKDNSASAMSQKSTQKTPQVSLSDADINKLLTQLTKFVPKGSPTDVAEKSSSATYITMNQP